MKQKPEFTYELIKKKKLECFRYGTYRRNTYCLIEVYAFPNSINKRWKTDREKYYVYRRLVKLNTVFVSVPSSVLEGATVSEGG